MPRPARAPNPKTAELVSANLPELLPRLLPIIPILSEPFYMLGTTRTAENVWYVDWGMPRAKPGQLRVVRHAADVDRIRDLSRGTVLWECPDALWAFGVHYNEVRILAQHREFGIKPTMEFVSWLKKHMQSCPQVQANGGLHVLAASLLRQQ